MLGFAARARKCIFGFQAVEGAVMKKKTDLVLADISLSENSAQKVRELCESKNVMLVFCEPGGEIGRRTGKDAAKVIAVTDRLFSDRLKEIVNLYNDNSEVKN